jgi:hypothetical protein
MKLSLTIDRDSWNNPFKPGSQLLLSAFVRTEYTMNLLHTYCVATILAINWATSLGFVKPVPAPSLASRRVASPIHLEGLSQRPVCESRRCSTSLQMIENPALAVAALTGAVSGGLFAGGLHAIAGKILGTSVHRQVELQYSRSCTTCCRVR